MTTELQSLKRQISHDLSITEPEFPFTKLDILQSWLAGEIRLLMDRDFNNLLNVLYRIDVNERKVKMAFAADDPAFVISGLIIERELKKVESRSKYSDPD